MIDSPELGWLLIAMIVEPGMISDCRLLQRKKLYPPTRKTGTPSASEVSLMKEVLIGREPH